MHSVFLVCSLVLFKNVIVKAQENFILWGSNLLLNACIMTVFFFQLTSCIIWDLIKQRLLSGFFFLWHRFGKIFIIRLKNGKTLKWFLWNLFFILRFPLSSHLFGYSPLHSLPIPYLMFPLSPVPSPPRRFFLFPFPRKFLCPPYTCLVI